MHVNLKWLSLLNLMLVKSQFKLQSYIEIYQFIPFNFDKILIYVIFLIKNFLENKETHQI